MAEVLEDLSVVHSSNVHRKRARQDSACTMEDNLALASTGAGNGSSSNHSSDDGLEGGNRESGRHKRQRGENHDDSTLPRTSNQWSLSTSSRSRSLSPASNTTQSSENSESTAFSPDDFIAFPTSHNQESLQESQRAAPNETNHAEEDIARSMEFDQQMDILRRSPDSLTSQSLEINQTPISISINSPSNISSEELSNSTHGENAVHRDARSDLVPRLLRRMHLRSNESSGSNLSSVGTDDMGSSSSNSLFRSASVNRLSNPLPNPHLRNLATSEVVSSPNPWHDFERQTLPSLVPTQPPQLLSRGDRTQQLPSLSHALRPRSGPRISFTNHDPITSSSSSRPNAMTRPDPFPPSSRSNPAPLRSSDWFQDMRDLFHPYTPTNFDDPNSSADSGRESPLSISDVAQFRQSPEADTRSIPAINTSQPMEGVERSLPSLSALRDRSNSAPMQSPPLHINLGMRPENNVDGGRLSEPAVNSSSLRRNGTERSSARTFSPVPWRNFLASLDSRENSLENINSNPLLIVPERERQQTNNQESSQGQSTSLVGTLRDLLHRSASTATQGDSPASRRRVRNPFRARTRSTSLDTEERISGLIDDDFPVLAMPPTATVRPSRSLLDPALRFTNAHSNNVIASVEQVQPSPTRLRRRLSLWDADLDDEDDEVDVLAEHGPFIPEPVRNERADPPRPRSFASIFGINRNPTTSLSGPSSNDRMMEPSWSPPYRNISESRSTIHPSQYPPGRPARPLSASVAVERPGFLEMEQDSDRTIGSSAFLSSSRESARSPRSPTSNVRPATPPHPHSDHSESYLGRLQRHLRRLPAINAQRNGHPDPPLSEPNARTSNLVRRLVGTHNPWAVLETTNDSSGYNPPTDIPSRHPDPPIPLLPTPNPSSNLVRRLFGTHDPWVALGTPNDSHRHPGYTPRPLSPDFLFSRRAASNSSDNLARNNGPHPNNRLSSRDSVLPRGFANEVTNGSNGNSDGSRTWRIPPGRNGESFNDLVRRRAARADALREAQSWNAWHRESAMSEHENIGSRTSTEQLRAERLARLERLRSSFNSFENNIRGDAVSSRPERERGGSHDQNTFIPRIVTDRSPLPPSGSDIWSNDTPSHWNDLPRLPSLGRIPPLGQSTTTPPEPQAPPFASSPVSRAFADPDSTSVEDDSSASVSRERQQLRDIISRRIRDEEYGPRGFLSRYDRSSSVQSDVFAPLADASARLQRRLRESEAQVDRALRALDQWGEMEQRDIEPSQSYLHRFGERRRLSSFVNRPSASDWYSSGSTNSFQAYQEQHSERRSPSPTTLNVRQQMRQARFARAQTRYREGSDLLGERRRSRFELRGFPRLLGDYIADEDFDSSYETLLQLSSLIGDVKPRGTAPHLLARMPTGFYKDFCEPNGETRCPICLDDYKDLDPVLRISDCGHWFHKGCLEQWLQNARTCPLCKTVVKGRQVGKRTADNVPGPSRRNDDSDNDDSRHDQREDSPSLTLEELGSYAAGWLR